MDFKDLGIQINTELCWGISWNNGKGKQCSQNKKEGNYCTRYKHNICLPCGDIYNVSSIPLITKDNIPTIWNIYKKSKKSCKIIIESPKSKGNSLEDVVDNSSDGDSSEKSIGDLLLDNTYCEIKYEINDIENRDKIIKEILYGIIDNIPEIDKAINKDDIKSIEGCNVTYSFIIFAYEVDKIKLNTNEFMINYQYSSGDYSWIIIKTIPEIENIGSKNNKDIINSELCDKDRKIIRLTKIRNKKIAEEFGYIIDLFDTQLQHYIQNKLLSTYDYLKMINIIDSKREILYRINNEFSIKNIENIKSRDLSIDKIINDPTNNTFIGGEICAMNGDCNERLTNVKDKSIQTICIDPPYNIGKDTWDNIINYNEWLTNIIVNLEQKLRDNGSMFIFHNNMEAISELMISIKKNTKLKFVQMITWNKRYDGSKKKGFLDGFVVKKEAHKFELMAEYILFYIFDNTYKYKEARIKNKVCAKDIQKEIPSKTGGMTGWYGNIETGLNYPTKERMKPITKHLGLEYDDVVPKFINQKKHHSVWNFDSAKKNKNCSHITPKPVALLENIIKHTTEEGDVLLDCFAGTGSLGRACINTNRKCVLIEKDIEYFDFIKSELIS